MKMKSILLLIPLVNCAVTRAANSTQYLNWKTFNSTGVNIGGWLEQESTIDTTWWANYSGGAVDEWGLCANLGSQCGPVLEQRYATWITTADIDTLAAAGITTLRIPTTYAAWVKVPGSQLYSGGQTSFLNISSYAISKYGMHIIIDIHSLPGGVNGLPVGEAEGHYGWFNNSTALNYSLQAVDAVINFINNSEFPQSFTIEPINEPADVKNTTLFGTPACLTDSGAQCHVPRQLQREEYWSSNFTAGTNLVFDVHNYYFDGRPVSSSNLTKYICEDAINSAGDGKFPVFVGEWSIQAKIDNTYSSREESLQTGLAAWKKYTRGSSYWTAKFSGNATVNGQGTQADYWSYENFIQLGYTGSSSQAVAC